MVKPLITNITMKFHEIINKYHKGGEHCEKRRNCLLQAISSFLTMFTIAKYF